MSARHLGMPTIRTWTLEELARQSAVRKQEQREERRDRDRRAWLRSQGRIALEEVESRHA